MAFKSFREISRITFASGEFSEGLMLVTTSAKAVEVLNGGEA